MPGLSVIGTFSDRATKSAAAAVPANTAQRAGKAPDIQAAGSADPLPVARSITRVAATVVAGTPEYRTIARAASSAIPSLGGSHAHCKPTPLLGATDSSNRPFMDRDRASESAMPAGVDVERSSYPVAFPDQRASVPARSRQALTTSAPRHPGGGTQVPCSERRSGLSTLGVKPGSTALEPSGRPSLSCACYFAIPRATKRACHGPSTARRRKPST